MSTSINLSNDLNDYLKKSGSTIGSSSAASSSAAAGGDGFLNTGWFSGPSTSSNLGGGGGGGGTSSGSRQWFAYKPLSTKDDDKEGLISGTSDEGPRAAKSSWFNVFGPREPEPKGWLPSLVCCFVVGIVCCNLLTLLVSSPAPSV